VDHEQSERPYDADDERDDAHAALAVGARWSAAPLFG
jgi:hypothetical protein